MKMQCEYCNAFIDDTDEFCPNCGGVNSHLVRSAIGTPKTIAELKLWCSQKNIPLEQARFFIGENYKGPRAFGIYKDENTENFIVYKNKSDGSRAIRYEGKDESYAVNEIFQKLKEEMLNQKQRGSSKSTSPKNTFQGRKKSLTSRLGFIITVCVFLAFVFIASISNGPRRGYYEYGNQVYYYQPNDGWYQYNNGNWAVTYVDETLSDSYDDYYESNSYFDSYDASDFTDSYYYCEDSDSSYDDDWDSSWDSGSDWDSGSTDWDSDW